jgi:hypothetical protein
MLAIEDRLQAHAECDLRSQRLQRAGGIGLITATALSASVGDFDSTESRIRPTEVPKGHDCNRTACQSCLHSVTCKGSPYTSC